MDQARGSGCGAGPDGAHSGIIARKTIRAPFRARVGLADVHIGQYLNEGTELTTLQGIDQAANVDFTVSQSVASPFGSASRSRDFGRAARANRGPDRRH